MSRITQITRWERRPDNKIPTEEGVVFVSHLEVNGKMDDVYATLRCPCGCRTPILYRLSPIASTQKIGVMLGAGVARFEPPMFLDSQAWKLTANADGTITLTPSMLLLDGCKSHFNITSSRVEWFM